MEKPAGIGPPAHHQESRDVEPSPSPVVDRSVLGLRVKITIEKR
jgi:hypothetical protein